MTRSNAREIAVHLIFALGFGTQSDQELLDSELTRERFQELAEDLPLYAQYPNEKQEQYIRKLVSGVFFHGPELDDCISRYSVGWAFSRIPRMAAAIMRTAMYEILYMPDIPNAAAINEAVELTRKYEIPRGGLLRQRHPGLLRPGRGRGRVHQAGEGRPPRRTSRRRSDHGRPGAGHQQLYHLPGRL